MLPMKYWEIIADKFHAAGWTWSYCSAVKLQGWRRGPWRFLKRIGPKSHIRQSGVPVKMLLITSSDVHPMKGILLILNISVLAITARGSLVLVSGTPSNTYDPSAAYRASGSFGGAFP